MSRLQKILIQRGVLRISKQRLEGWKSERDIEMLAYVALHGSYREREAAVCILGLIEDPEAISALKAALSDKVKVVALAAVEALTRVRGDSAYQKEIEATLAYWADRERQRQQSWNKSQNIESTEKLIDKSKMVRFNGFKRKVIKQMNQGQFY